MASKDQRTKPQSLYIWRLKHSRLRSELHDRVAKRIVAGFAAGLLIDLGCGPGLLAKKLRALAPEIRVVGIDIDKIMLNEARTVGITDLVHASADHLPFRDDSVGLLVSTTSLKDWTNRAEGLAETCRIVRPGGTAFVYDFVTAGPESNPLGFAKRYGVVSEILRRATGWVQPFSLADAMSLAQTIRSPSVRIDISVERDLAVVVMVITKLQDEGIGLAGESASGASSK